MWDHTNILRDVCGCYFSQTQSKDEGWGGGAQWKAACVCVFIFCWQLRISEQAIICNIRTLPLFHSLSDCPACCCGISHSVSHIPQSTPSHVKFALIHLCLYPPACLCLPFSPPTWCGFMTNQHMDHLHVSQQQCYSCIHLHEKPSHIALQPWFNNRQWCVSVSVCVCGGGWAAYTVGLMNPICSWSLPDEGGCGWCQWTNAGSRKL